jgi:hypothetical protein
MGKIESDEKRLFNNLRVCKRGLYLKIKFN